jgi:hypothetical protein
MTALSWATRFCCSDFENQLGRPTSGPAASRVPSLGLNFDFQSAHFAAASCTTTLGGRIGAGPNIETLSGISFELPRESVAVPSRYSRAYLASADSGVGSGAAAGSGSGAGAGVGSGTSSSTIIDRWPTLASGIRRTCTLPCFIQRSSVGAEISSHAAASCLFSSKIKLFSFRCCDGTGERRCRWRQRKTPVPVAVFPGCVAKGILFSCSQPTCNLKLSAGRSIRVGRRDALSGPCHVARCWRRQEVDSVRQARNCP